MHITGTGIIMLVGIFAIIGGIFAFKFWRSGGSLSVKSVKTGFTRQKKDPDSILCLNVYPTKIVGENMLKKSVHPDAKVWELGTRKYLLQKVENRQYLPLELPDEIAYPPERLARMMGCEPLRRLKSLKFKWYEQLAPFAPVIALVIGSILLIVVV